MTPAARIRFQRIQTIGAAITCVAVVGIGLSLSVPLLSFAMQARGASGTFIGINTAMAGIAAIMVAPAVPRAAMHVGIRTLLLLALVLGAATFIGFWLAQSLWLWFPLRFLFGVSLAVLFVLSEFWINAVAPDHARGLVMGIYSTVLALGFAAGPTVLAAFPNGPAPYVAGAFLFVAAALPLAFAGDLLPTISEPPKSHPFIFMRAAPSAVIAAFVFGAVETGGMSFLPLYGLSVGYGDVTSALLVSILAVGNVLVQIPLGCVSDRMDRRRLLLMLALIGAVGAAVLPLIAHHVLLLFPLVAIWGGLVGGLYTVGLAHLGSQFRGSELAAANATYILMYSLGIVLGPPIFGVGLDLWNPNGLPATISLLFIIYLVVVVARGRETQPAAAPPVEG
jgi:MFS family permease